MESRKKCFSLAVSGFRYRSAHLGLCLPFLFLSFWFWSHFAPFQFLVFAFVSFCWCLLLSLVHASSLVWPGRAHLLQKSGATPSSPLSLNKENFAEVDS